MLEIDFSLWPPGTLWIQIANFLFLLFILNIILYKPVRNILGKRKDEMDSFEEMIGDFQDKSDRYAKELEGSRIDARNSGFKEKEVLKGQGLEEEKNIVQEASSSSEEKIGKAREEIEERLANVRSSLQAQVEGFSQELAEKILGRSI
jgi:F-type H+-transporting ATPase subunit b